MAKRKALKDVQSILAVSGFISCALLVASPGAAAGPVVVQPPYTISTFAVSTNGYSAPDSIVQWKDSILVGFGNGVAKDGSDGKSSTIVQYSLSGQVQRTFSVKGHNDGLRVKPGEDDNDELWALQNEDANPNLVIIDLNSGKQKTYTFAPTVHGGGFDDIRFRDEQVFMTASNPNLDINGINVYPALVLATISGNMVNVDPVLYGNASAIDIPTGATVTLNLTDPDSLTQDPRGNLLLDDQGDGQLVFIQHPFTDDQTVGQINLTTSAGPVTVDDTAFAPSPHAFLLVTDLSGNKIYRIDNPTFGFEPGAAYSASDTAGFVGVLNLDTGGITPIVAGLGSGRGLLFVVHNGD